MKEHGARRIQKPRRSGVSSRTGKGGAFEAFLEEDSCRKVFLMDFTLLWKAGPSTGKACAVHLEDGHEGGGDRVSMAVWGRLRWKIDSEKKSPRQPAEE